MEGIFAAWGKILQGRRPMLSIEITRECPLSCPGCYAFGPEHLGSGMTLKQMSDFTGEQLVSKILELVDREKPLHVSLVGGEPLVRYRELNQLLPQLAERGVHTQLVTSAVRPIPTEWASIPRLQICVSIDGLQPEHDARRKPATYERILKHIAGQSITVHCTVTRQQTSREAYLEQFVEFWSQRAETKRIWISLYTPQIDEDSPEKLQPKDRRKVVSELLRLRKIYPKLHMPEKLISVYAEPPDSPSDCIFARLTQCVSADFRTAITPCQFGGNPDCRNCGCMASAGLAAVGRHRLLPYLPISHLLDLSMKIGNASQKVRRPVAVSLTTIPE